MKREQKGFTLIEMVVVVAIIGLVSYAGTLAVFRVIRGTQRSNDQMIALRQVQNAGYWVSRDLIVAQEVLPGNDISTPQTDLVTLAWTNWESGEIHTVHYYYEDMPNGLKKLERHNVTRGQDGVTLADVTTFVAQNIVSPPVLTKEANVWKFVILAQSRNQTETREYDVRPRFNA